MRLELSKDQIRQLWFAIGCGIVVAIIVLSLIPEPTFGDATGIDKVEHALAYGTLMLWFAQLYLRARWLWVAFLCLALGVLLEYAQRLTGLRSFGYDDMVANAVGVGLGWMLACAGLNDWVLRVERWAGATAS